MAANAYRYFSFSLCRDQDFPGGILKTIVFRRGEKYESEGYTHGLVSHSVKHLRELEPAYVKEKLGVVAGIIKKAPQAYLLNSDGSITARQKEASDSINQGILLNTLDMVNDKIINHLFLTPPELEIKRVLTELSDRYMALINAMVARSADIAVVPHIDAFAAGGGVLRFEGRYRGFCYTYYLDFSNSALLVRRKDNHGTLNTCFRIDKYGKSPARIARYFRLVDISEKRLTDFFLNYFL